MKLSSPNPGRPAWYDRNPEAIGRAYIAGPIAPHAFTVRFTYTVPAGRKAMVEQAATLVIQDTAASAAHFVRAMIETLGLTGIDARVVESFKIELARGTRDARGLGATLLLRAGQGLQGATQDLQTAGAVVYSLAVKLTEFDA